MTQRDLAGALGVPVWTVDLIETGASDGTRYIGVIADVTQRQPEWFVRSAGPRAFPASAADADTRDTGELARNLVLGSIALLVTIRFFTEVIPVVPRAANFVDIPIFVILVVAASRLPRASVRHPGYLALAFPAALFLALALASAVVNGSRAAPAPVVVFIYGFLGPVAVFASVYRLWPPGNARALSRLLIALGLAQLAVVVLIDLPHFVASGNNPDVISGTFGSNAYQLVFFLLVIATLLAGIFTVEPRRSVARFAPVLLLAIFGTILLAQYRALLATTVITIVVVALMLGRRARGLVIASTSIVAFFAAFSYVASNFPLLKLDVTATTLTNNPASYVRERVKVAGIVERLYTDDPFAAVIGTGPGTFSSRAWQTFSNAGSSSGSNVQGGYATALTGGVYETDVSTRYVRSQLSQGPIIEGSGAVRSPYSSYIALLAEVGVFGFMLVVGIYGAVVARAARVSSALLRNPSPDDSLPSLALATTIAFLTLVQMAFLENWFEVTRITFVAWAMLAVVLKELGTRSPART